MNGLNTVIIDGLAFSLPLFIIGIGGIYSERSGVTNLALEGLLGVGAFFGALVTVLISGFFPSGSQVPMYIAMAAAVAGGTLYSLLHALLCIRFKANQVISGVVINILAMALTTFFTSQINSAVFDTPSDKFDLGTSARFTVPVLSKIPVLGAVFREMYPFEIIIVVVAVIAWYVLYRTPFGVHLRACGENPNAVDAAGIHVGRVRLRGVMVSGALAGLGGMCFAYSISANYSSSIYAGFGYLAIAAMIFGNWKIVPTLGACLIFGFARSGGYKIIQMLGMPSSFQDLVMILPYLITLILLVFFSHNNRAPRALGEIYDKGKR